MLSFSLVSFQSLKSCFLFNFEDFYFDSLAICFPKVSLVIIKQRPLGFLFMIINLRLSSTFSCLMNNSGAIVMYLVSLSQMVGRMPSNICYFYCCICLN